MNLSCFHYDLFKTTTLFLEKETKQKGKDFLKNNHSNHIQIELELCLLPTNKTHPQQAWFSMQSIPFQVQLTSPSDGVARPQKQQ